MPANELSFNQISAEMNAIHAQAIGAQPPRAINTGAVMTQAQAALLGADVQLVPLTITENGTYNPPAGKGFGTVTAEVPNPNSVETITGTLANPWGTMESQEISALFADLANGDASAIITVDASAIGSGSTSCALISVENFCIASGLAVDDTQTGSGFRAIWSSTYLAAAYVVSISGSNCSVIELDEYASILPTSTQIFRHPMPTSTEDAT